MNLPNYKKGFANIIFAIVLGALAVITGAFIEHKVGQPAPAAPQASAPLLAGAINYPTGGGTYRLASSISSTQTTVKVSSFKEPTSNIPYTMSYLNASQEYATIDAQTSISEFISFTGITQNTDGTATLTGVTRGLSRSYPYTASTTFQTAHSAQATLVLSNPPQLYNDIYTYIQNATYAGTVDMTTSVKGIAQRATGAQAAAHAADGSGGTTAPLVLSASIASSTRTANTAQVVVASSTNGYIDNSYINGNGLVPGMTVTSASTTFATSSLNIGAFPAYQIGKNAYASTSVGSANFAVPSGVTKLYVIICGGGGGGGGSNSSPYSGGSGGGGGCAYGMVDVTATTSVQFTIGAAGTAGGAGSGGTGGTSYFGPSNNAFLTAAGGNSGGAATGGGTAGGGGGTASGGFLNVVGGTGAYGIGGSTSFVPGLGTGGASPFFGAYPAPGTGGPGGASSAGGIGIVGGMVIYW